MKIISEHEISDRFRGFLPVVIDVETGGFVAGTDALTSVGNPECMDLFDDD